MNANEAARSSHASAADDAVRIRDLTVSFATDAGAVMAVDGVSLHVREGEFVSVVGLNGAGKTTLFNALSGLVAYRGTIRFDGRDLRGMSGAAIARAGLVQCPETRELFGDMTVRENLELGGYHLADTARAKQLAWLFDLFPVLESRQSQTARTPVAGTPARPVTGTVLTAPGFGTSPPRPVAESIRPAAGTTTVPPAPTDAAVPRITPTTTTETRASTEDRTEMCPRESACTNVVDDEEPDEKLTCDPDGPGWSALHSDMSPGAADSMPTWTTNDRVPSGMTPPVGTSATRTSPAAIRAAVRPPSTATGATCTHPPAPSCADGTVGRLV